jgi:tape measure domain-containing protein
MATNNTTDVELRIRATNYSKKTTTEVTDALKDLVKAEEAQIEASKKGAASAADLEKGYAKIESAVKALLGQQSLIKLFQSQSAALDDVKAKLEAARSAQADYAKYVADSGKQTPAQTKALKEQATAVSQLEKEMGRLEAKVNTSSANLRQFGVDASNAAQTQQKIVVAVTAANAALDRQEAAMDAADGFAKQARDAAKAAAAAEQKARADKLVADATAKATAALAAQARAEQEVAAAEAMRNVQHEADMEALFTREANKRTEAINRQAVALRDAADAAERQMRASATTARGNTAPVTTPTVSQRLTDIAQPAQASLRSVDALGASITDLTAKVAAIDGPVRNYRDILQQAQQAQKALADMGGLLDSYNRQIAAIRTARSEYTAARAEVTALITAMRSGAAGDDITTRLARAQSTLERSATNLGNLTTSARTTQAALRAAGVDTTNLAAAETNLISQATRAASAMQTLTTAYQRNGAAADNAGSALFRWFSGDGGRTTLSFAQRLRGEVLGLATAFVGLNAAIDLAKKTIEAYNLTQATMNRLLVASGGDTELARQEFEYLQAAADRIGVSFTKVAPAYAKFAIAAKQAGQTTAQTRYIFEGFATATARLGLSSVEAERVFKALEQMFNKGKVSAEELTQQLGDALPGALNLFAKAKGVSTQEFTKLMQDGAIGPELIVTVAKQLQETYGAINAGTTNLSQAQARFENATNTFLNNVAKGGFVEAYQGLLERLTKFLEDGSADKLAQSLSSGFTIVIDVLDKVAQNLDLVKVGIELILALKFVSWLASLPALLRAFSAELVIVNGALFTMQARLNAASAAVALSQALGGASGLTGVMLKLAPAIIGVGNALLFLARSIPVIGAFILAYQATSAILDGMDDKVRANVQSVTNTANKAFEEANKAQADLEKKRGTDQEKAAQEKYDRLKKIAVDGINAQQAAIKAAQAKGVKLDGVKFASTSDKTGGTGSGTDFPGESDPSARKLEALQADLLKEQKKTERAAQNERLKAAKGDLAARLDLIDQEYDERREKAKTEITDSKLQADAIAAINKASLEKQAVERAKYNNEQAKKDKTEGEQRIKIARQVAADLVDLQAKLNEQQAQQAGTSLPIEDQVKAAKAAVDKTFTDITEKINRLAKYNPSQAKSDLAQVATLKKQAEAIAETNTYREQANNLSEEFNKKQKIMQTNIASIQQQVDSGQISIMAGNNAINEQIAQYGPGVQEAGKAALDFATKFQAMLDPVKYAEIVATVKAGTAKAGVDAQTAANNVVTAQKLLNNLLEAEARERDSIEQQRSLNLITSEQETDQLNETAAKYQGSILQMTQNLQAFIATARDANAMSADELDRIAAATDKISTNAKFAQKSLSDLDVTIKDSIVNNGVTAFDAIGESLAKVALGQQSISAGFKSMGQAALAFFASLLKDITQAIIKQQILNALQGFFGGGATPGASNVAPIPVAHAGGAVGTQLRSRAVNPAMFVGAKRYHDGGLPGLKADEVPTILQKGEEVLTKNDARNVLNGGAGVAQTDPTAGVRFVLVDDRARVPEAMAGADGSKVVVQHIKANIPTIKTMLGIR